MYFKVLFSGLNFSKIKLHGRFENFGDERCLECSFLSNSDNHKHSETLNVGKATPAFLPVFSIQWKILARIKNRILYILSCDAVLVLKSEGIQVTLREHFIYALSKYLLISHQSQFWFIVKISYVYSFCYILQLSFVNVNA